MNIVLKQEAPSFGSKKNRTWKKMIFQEEEGGGG